MDGGDFEDDQSNSAPCSGLVVGDEILAYMTWEIEMSSMRGRNDPVLKGVPGDLDGR